MRKSNYINRCCKSFIIYMPMYILTGGLNEIMPA